MLSKRAILASLAVRALSALASPVDRLVVQEPLSYPVSDHTCAGTESAEQLASTPEVYLDDALFTGIRKGATDQFLGIPFAYPPTNERRLRQPEPLPPYEGLYYVQEYGKSCPQQRLDLPNGLDSQLVKDVSSVVNVLLDKLTPQDEDCLTINVVKPSSATPTSKLPVIFWIFGGGFEIGGTSTYDGGSFVARSIDLGQPVIYVSVNYRLSAFGFLPGKEVKAEKVGNLGLQDQRLGLKWVQTYISEFGGDPSKVTIWGESAGAISSGGPIPVGDIENGQRYYDFMVEKTGCSRAKDTLDCLRKVPYTTYKRAMDDSPDFFAYQGLVLAWLPRVDGVFLKEPTQYSVVRGNVANVPMIAGNCDDEGSLFSISTMNITTTAELKDYMKLYMMPKAKDSQVDLLLKYYPDDQRAGCPFDTGLKNALSPQFKRTAALQGDFVFHGPRRYFLQHRADKQKSWGFIHKRGKDLPFVGAAHITDVPNSFGVGPALSELRDYFIRFTNNLDPNGKRGLGVPWPQWDPRKPKAAIFQDSTLFPIIIGDDNYRTDALNYVANMSLLYPI
ncbi:carotenoid ester lipase precursor [Lactarius akahatsu]|uniref:Carboxylic ester hydrolase n=1 Tax=Lactarius akahatsu TaxID=416441 RepID=A0AAD4Q922_9AGAM|nr:carotenoid ester lipase precursor [Lactarius akahatsu]